MITGITQKLFLLFFALSMVLFNSSCQQQPQTNANCDSTESYNNKSRKCEKLPVILDRRPRGTLSKATIVEDSSNNLIQLSYTDADDDLANTCAVVSVDATNLVDSGANAPSCTCTGGVCVAKITPRANIPVGHTDQASQFQYTISDLDGTGAPKVVAVTIKTIEDLPKTLGEVSTYPVPGGETHKTQTASTKNEDNELIWTLGYYDADNGDNSGSPETATKLFELASTCTISNLSANFDITTACSCSQITGACTVGITSKSNYNNDSDVDGFKNTGQDTFDFSITTNGITSSKETIDLAIDPVNDAPIIPALTIQSSLEEIAEILTPVIQLDEGGASDEDNQTLTISRTGTAFTRTGNLTTSIDDHNIRILKDDGTGTYVDIGDATSPRVFGATADPKIKIKYIPNLVVNDISYRSVNSDDDGVTLTMVDGATGINTVGKAITVTTNSDTATNIATLINSNPDASNLIVATALIGTTVQTAAAFAADGAVVGATKQIITNENGTATVEFQLADNGTFPINGSPQTTVRTYQFELIPVDDKPINTGAGTFTPAAPQEDESFTVVLGYNDPENDQATLCTLKTVENISGTCACSAGVCTATLIGDKNFSTAANEAKFTYTVTANGLESEATEIAFNIANVNDAPIVCEFTHFSKAKECGLQNCIGDSSPVGRIVPTSHTVDNAVYFYEKGNAVCWKSTSNGTNNDWTALTTGYIGDKIVNSIGKIVIDTLRVDEGGGGGATGEDDEEVQIESITLEAVPANNPNGTTLLPEENITFFYNTTDITLTNPSKADFTKDDTVSGTSDTSSDEYPYRIEINPVTALSGTVKVTLTFKDNSGLTNDTTDVSFNVQVDPITTLHKGWKNISSVGPRVTRDDLLITSKTNNCSFNLTKCNSGTCSGGADPSGAITPIENSTIYYNSSSKACFISNGVNDNTKWESFDTPCNVSDTEKASSCTQAKLTNNGLIYRSLIEDGEDISIILEDRTATETSRATNDITSSGNVITVLMKHSGGAVTTTAQELATDLNADADSNTKIRVEVISGAGTNVQTALAQTSLVPQASCVDTGTPNCGEITHAGLSFYPHEFDSADSITFQSGGSEAVNIVGKAITVTYDGSSTSQSLENIIKTQAAALIDVKINEYDVTPTALTTTNFEPNAACIVPKSLDDHYYDSTNNKCYRVVTDNFNDLSSTQDYFWEQYSATAETTIEWNPYGLLGDGTVIGWNVYRKIGDDSYRFDINSPINREPIAASTYKFVDNVTNSYYAPVPKTVYHYEVRPLIKNASSNLEIITDTDQTFKTIKVVTPPNNMSFVHRWIANQTMCNLMHATDIDSENNFRCAYNGPGNFRECNFTKQACGANGDNDCTGTADPTNTVDSTSGALYFDTDDNICYKNTDGTSAGWAVTTNDQFFIGYYDIGKDLLVDTFEAGCPFSRSPACDFINGGDDDGTCAGLEFPDGNVNAEKDAVYYQRTSGKCFVNTSAGNTSDWKLISSTEYTPDYRKAEYPPLANISNSQAKSFCQATTTKKDALSYIVGYKNSVEFQLPNRFQQMSYSQWSTDITDTNISDTERGINLNSTSKCNSSSASGLESFYTNSVTPGPLNVFTYPGTESSGIRSMATGSTQTASCVSRFGVQDFVGNVAEWVQDGMDCTNLKTCSVLNTSDYKLINSENPKTWGFDGDIGPCSDVSAANVCDSFMDRWFIDDEKFNSEAMFIPVGMPVHGDYKNLNQDASVNDSIFEIGPTSGITANQLRQDEFIFNTHEIFSSTVGKGNFATGGSYLSGQGAGTYYLRLLPQEAAYGYVVTDVFAMKSLTPLTNEANYQFHMSTKLNCNFTSSQCDTSFDSDGVNNNDCIGFGDPNDKGITALADGDAEFYYDFKNDTCYTNTVGSPDVWTDTGAGPNSHNQTPVVKVNEEARVVYIVLESDNSQNLLTNFNDTDLTNALNNACIIPVGSSATPCGTAADNKFAYSVTGSTSTILTGLSAPIKFNIPTAQPAQVDVGFRCIAPLEPQSFNKDL